MWSRKKCLIALIADLADILAKPERRRKLLLHKKQIQKLEQETKGTGMTLVPLKVYIKDGYAKLLLGLAKGKHDYDKRESIKRREQDRDIARVMKAVNHR